MRRPRRRRGEALTPGVLLVAECKKPSGKGVRGLRHKIAAVLVLGGLSFLLWNVAANGHLHRLPDGRIRFHCHPFQSPSKKGPSDYPAHHHTNFAFGFYSLLTNLTFLGATLAAVILLLPGARPFPTPVELTAPSFFSLSPQIARAPPSAV